MGISLPIILIAIAIALFKTNFIGRMAPEKRSEPQVEYGPKVAVPPPIKKIEKQFEDIIFPKDFFFGTASSIFQTAGLGPNSDWEFYWQKIALAINADFKSKGVDRKAIYPGTADDFFTRYKEDADLAGQIGASPHRISLEWSLIEPEEGKWDLQQVKQIKEIISYFKSRGIEIMVCLNHFPNPKWFTDKGGWSNPRSEYDYEKYAAFVAKSIGLPLKIKWWLTFNEPQFSITVPYVKGDWPPFKGLASYSDVEGSRRMLFVASNIIDGHRLAYRAIHHALDNKFGKVMVSFASAPGSFYPDDPNMEMDKIAHNVFNAVYTLSLDSFVGNSDRDFIGLNYYGRTKIKLHMSLWDKAVSWLTEEKPFAFQWNTPPPQGNRPKEFYPKGLYDLIMQFKDLDVPIVITENGVNNDSDEFREEFIVIHLKAVHDAIRNGANVVGYQYWALSDTWEPGDGSFSHFGLIKIDRENNLERSLRKSSTTYSAIIKTHRISKELLEKHKELAPD